MTLPPVVGRVTRRREDDEEVCVLAHPSFKGRSVAIVIHDDSVLMVRSKRDPEAWVPPGGTIEHHETTRKAADRETFEETGVRVSAARLVGYGELWDGDRDVLELYFSAALLDASDARHTGEFAIGEEGRTAQWLPLSALQQTRHYPKALRELCRVARTDGAAPIYLGPRDMGSEEQ